MVSCHIGAEMTDTNEGRSMQKLTGPETHGVLGFRFERSGSA